MTPEERDALRDLLVRYESALALAEDLALSLLEVLQPGAVEIPMDQARERRRFVGDALTSVEAGDEFAKKVWEKFALERRKTPSAAARPPQGQERRRPRQRRRGAKK